MSLPRLPLPKTRIALAAAALAAGAGLSPAVLAKAPAGGEFQVNTFITGTQSAPAIAIDADGDFVVAWQSNNQDGGSFGIYAQRYNALGAPQGSEFRVNTFTTTSQGAPAIALDADGDFVIAWLSQGQDDPATPSGTGIYAQRYNAMGAAQGGEFRVNTFTAGNQQNPAIAMDADGDFVIAWQSAGQDDPAVASGTGVYAQRYNALGAAQGGEFRVNTTTTGNQQVSAIALDANGDFVVAWSGNGSGDTTGIHAQRYNAAGVAQGSEFRVNTFIPNLQQTPAVAMDADGDFVIAWDNYGRDGSGYGTYAQRYSAMGVAQGSEFRVNTYTTGNQQGSAVAMDADGDFVIVWRDRAQDGSTDGTYALRYNALGVAQGSEFRVNTFTTGNQTLPAIALDADGDFVVSWQSANQDLSDAGSGIYAQRYQAVTLTPSLTVTTSGAATNTTSVPNGPAGTYSFNAQFCNNVAQTLTGLSSKTLTLTNSNNLLNRTRDALAAPGAAAIPPGGVGTEKDVTAAGGYADLALASSECVTVPYQIGLQNRNRFNFTVRIRGDNGM